MTPALFAETAQGQERFWEFFGGSIRNRNTRLAYVTAAYRFADWCEDRELTLSTVRPLHIAGYIEQLTQTYAAATVKQNLAGLRQLFDWLVVGQVIPTNPAAAIRGPKHVVKTGKTPVLTADETRSLFDSIDTTAVIGLRDRALVAVMTYAFARVSAALAMRVADYYTQGKRSYFRLHEKGGEISGCPGPPYGPGVHGCICGAGRLGRRSQRPTLSIRWCGPADRPTHQPAADARGCSGHD